MADKVEVERQIRELLTVDMDAVTFSNTMFEQGKGLFVQLADTREERQELVKGELWKQLKARLRELEARDLERFREVVKAVEQHHPPGSYVLRLEAAQSS